MSTQLAQIRIETESDVFAARREVRDMAAELGFDNTDQVRVASAVSDWGRVLVGGEVPAVVRFELEVDPQSLVVRITADDPAGFERARTAGLAAHAGGPLMDTVDIDMSLRTVRLMKRLPAGAQPSHRTVSKLQAQFAKPVRASLLEDLQAQNGELLRTLEQLTAKQADLVRANDELDETNRGVMAMYTQLSTELEETNRGVVALYGELDERGAQLRDANNAKSRFLANVSHELRSPLNSILALTTLLREPDSAPLTADQDGQLRLIQADAARLQEMVDELLDLAKAESGRLQPQFSPVDLAGLVNDLCAALRPVTPADVELVAELPHDLPELRTDGMLLGQVLRNLLSNALKFTERGRVSLIITRPTADLMTFAVADSGIGIAEKDLELVFEEFFQVPGPLQVRLKGTGLGLPYAQRVVAVLGGTLTLSSTPGTGSTFAFTLPVTPDGHPEPPPMPALGTVLVVDDELGFRHLVRALLHGAASRVVEADGVAAALAALQGLTPDLVLVDLRMPDGSGEEVLEAMSADHRLRDVPAVIVTSMTPTTRASLLAGGWPVIDKAQLAEGTFAAALASALEGWPR